MTDVTAPPQNTGGLRVSLPSGADYPVLTREEADYINERRRRYESDNKMVNVSDLQDMDRVLYMELLSFRWSIWLSRREDYWGDDIDERALRQSLSDYSGELRQLKKGLGIDKVARDRQKGDDSVTEFLARLKERAQAFGYMREAQLDRALVLFNDLKGRVILHDNCDTDERREQRCNPEDILAWVRDKAIPEYDEVDAYFRANHQRLWIRRQ